MRLRQQHNVADRDVEIEIIAEEFLATDRSLADIIIVSCTGRLAFRQLDILRANRDHDTRAFAQTLAGVRLDLAQRRAHDATAISHRADPSGDKVGAADEISDELVARLLVNLA